MAKKGSKFKKYSAEFKIKVVEDYLSGRGGGYLSTARINGLDSKWLVRDWVRKYIAYGPAYFYINNRKNNSGRSKSNKVDYEGLSDKEKIEYLEMENAILKKLKAIQSQKEK